MSGARAGRQRAALPVRLFRVAAGRRRLMVSAVVGVLAWLGNPEGRHGLSRVILAWDTGVALFLLLAAHLFFTDQVSHMEEHAEAQQEGEWTIFTLTVAGIVLSFAAIISSFSGLKGVPDAVRDLRVALVTITLVLSWLMAHVTFALRYAHEYYSTDTTGEVEGGLEFPRTERPDYLDFVYFSLVLGMTFQVSDVVIASRKLRRLATLHGLLSFLFNTVILALTVNLAAGLL